MLLEHASFARVELLLRSRLLSCQIGGAGLDEKLESVLRSVKEWTKERDDCEKQMHTAKDAKLKADKDKAMLLESNSIKLGHPSEVCLEPPHASALHPRARISAAPWAT